MSSSEIPLEIVEAFHAEFRRLLDETLRETFANLTLAMVETEVQVAKFACTVVADEIKVLGDNPEYVMRNPSWTRSCSGS